MPVILLGIQVCCAEAQTQLIRPLMETATKVRPNAAQGKPVTGLLASSRRLAVRKMLRISQLP